MSDWELLDNQPSNTSSDWEVESGKINKKPDQSSLPFPLNIALGLAQSLSKPGKQQVQEHGQAFGRGFTDIGEGLKQLMLRGKEKEDYTNQVEGNRKFYEENMGGGDILNKTIREAASSSPYMAIGGPSTVVGRNLIEKMLLSGLTTGNIAGASFIPHGESRVGKAIMAGLGGAAIPALTALPKGFGKLSDLFGRAFKNLTPEQEALLKSSTGFEQATEGLQAAKEKSRELTGKSDIGMLKREANKLKEENAGNMALVPNNANSGKLDQASTIEKQELQNTENEISSHLNKGAQHDVRVASRMDNLINESKQDIGSIYDTVEQDLSNKNIILRNQDDARKVSQELADLASSGKDKSPEMVELADSLKSLVIEKSIPARDYLAAYRTARDASYDARKYAYRHGISDEERMDAFRRADELENKSSQMKEILEKGIGEENSHLLKQANNRWSNEIAPLFKNKVYQKIRYEGRLPENMMKTLRGTGQGMEQLRDIIKKDPELLRNVVGQRYAKNPTGLHDIGELEQEYVEKMPELQELLKKHKSHQAHIGMLEKQSSASQVGEKIKVIDKQIKNLIEKSKAKKMSLKEKVQIESQLRDLEKQKKSARKKIGIAAGLGLAVTGGPPALSKLYHLLSPSENQK